MTSAQGLLGDSCVVTCDCVLLGK